MTDTGNLGWLVRTPYSAAAYMHANGWRMLGASSTESLWALDANEQTWEALLPLDAGRRDAQRRVHELLTVLAAVEKRTEEELVRDLRAAQSDVIRVRAMPDSPSGTAPIDEAVQVISASREMLLSVAASEEAPRAVLGSRKSDRAVSFVRSVRLATEPGSFVVALEAPVTPDLETAAVLAEAGGKFNGALFPGPRVPFARRVTERLARAVDVSLNACAQVSAGDDLTAFDVTVPDGVSANLLEALARLGGAPDADPSRSREVSLAIRWSYGRHAPAVRASYVITRDAIPVYAAAAASLRARQPEPDVRLVGQVVGLQRDDTLATDTVTLAAIVDSGTKERLRRVRLVLDTPEQRQLVVRAYDTREPVIVSGDLQPGRPLTMNPVTSLELALSEQPDAP